jgi:hypothetical protein
MSNDQSYQDNGQMMVECGGYAVTAEWAQAQTATEANAREYLGYAEENILRGYFPEGHAVEAAFIRAKYPNIAQ